MIVFKSIEMKNSFINYILNVRFYGVHQQLNHADGAAFVYDASRYGDVLSRHDDRYYDGAQIRNHGGGRCYHDDAHDRGNATPPIAGNRYKKSY